MTYQLTTLPNGLRVASEFLPGVKSVAVAVNVGVGARYESEAENGISHLLEHMAFKGTTTRSAQEIAEVFDAIGGQLNAYTSMELTVYYAKVLKENTGTAVEILADIMQNSTFAEHELVREKEVIIQEIAMHRDSPDDVIVDNFDSLAFPAQPLGRSILSTEEKVSSHSREDIMKYMSRHYRPERMVITAAGNIRHEDFVALVEKHFAIAQTTPAPGFEKAKYHGGDSRVTADFEQLHLIIGLPTIPMHSPDYYALQIYSTILGGGMSSRLFQEVREKAGLAYSVYSMASAYEDVGMMSVYAAAAPEKGAELSGIICEQIKGMAEEISDQEFSRARNQQKAELLMARESPQTVATWIGRHLLMFGEYRSASEIIKRIDAVTKDQILKLAASIANGKLTVAALGNDVSKVLPYEELSAKLAA